MLSMRRERRGSTEETDLENMTIGGAMLKEMFLTGAALLEKNRAYIDSLNGVSRAGWRYGNQYGP